ncbi:MAG: 4-alpha-glucanotransferase, partial [Epsilonproteobacteria bacterium]|nr:4-alpha-glucanotransferase [Campylobacterota bacterium]
METDLFQKRRAGILLHPTSLPGPYGIGSFGRWAYRWIDRLHESGVGIWQVLPLGPTGFGDSPYQCYSAFAGNPLLIDLPLLEEEGFICENLHGSRDDFEEERVDFERVRAYKLPLLFQAYRTMRRNGLLREAFETFCAKESHWLDDYALFMALKERHGGRAWQSWEPALARRDPDALKAFASAHTEAVDRWRFWQFLFERQWQNLRSYARLKGVEIVGDMPIYVAEDSSDVWAASHLFELDDHGYPRRVAGVPPDAFSATGQRWGNPLYAWDAMAKEGYAWWRRRMARALSLYDHVRIDHFRGFESYWAISAEAETAADGEWVKGPGKAFFDRLGEDLGPMPLIAEDLGIITDEVTRLRESLRMPGMK